MAGDFGLDPVEHGHGDSWWDRCAATPAQRDVGLQL
jgi:hypothetical protein